jgi:N utilization substance protein B
MLAVQSMYSKDILNDKKTLPQISEDYISHYIDKYPDKKLDQEFYMNLFSSACNNFKSVDKKISANLESTWKLERLPKLVLAILRVGGNEIITASKKHIALMINDYLQISKSLGHEEDTGFINSILDKIAKE